MVSESGLVTVERGVKGVEWELTELLYTKDTVAGGSDGQSQWMKKMCFVVINEIFSWVRKKWRRCQGKACVVIALGERGLRVTPPREGSGGRSRWQRRSRRAVDACVLLKWTICMKRRGL